jgi:hypothetical protein
MPIILEKARLVVEGKLAPADLGSWSCTSAFRLSPRKAPRPRILGDRSSVNGDTKSL